MIVKLLTTQSAFTRKLITSLPKALARTNYSLELVTIRSFRNYESYATELFKASSADLFIPCLPNSYWIHADKVQHHVTSMLGGYEVSWHPVVMRDHRASSIRSWRILDAPTKYSQAFSQTFFTGTPAHQLPWPVTLSLDYFSGKHVERLRLPMVQASTRGLRKKAIHWLNTYQRTNDLE